MSWKESSSSGLKRTLQQAAVPPMAGFTDRNSIYFLIRSLTPQQAAGNALAIAVQAEDADPITIGPGEVLTLPSNLPHMAEALEDTLDVEIFAPFFSFFLVNSCSSLLDF